MDQSAWDEVVAAIEAAPYPVRVLPADAVRAQECLATLAITPRSWLGAVVANTGGVLVDHGWLRVLGSGHAGVPDVASEAEPAESRVVVGYDVMGGQFAWLPSEPGAAPTIHYFGPDRLDWQDLNRGYADWLHAMLGGALTQFYDTLRWPGWETEVEALAPGEGLVVWPPPFTQEGKDVSAASRKAIPHAELVSFYQDMARQLG